MEQFQVEMTTLCEKLVAIMLGSLCLTDTKWFKPKNECDQAQLILDVSGRRPSPGGNINGLQFYDDGMEWVDLEPVEGALIVNIGDLMQIVSNGRFKLVLHSVVANNTRHRISKWFFYLPPWDDVVLPLKKLVEFDRLPMYRTVIWKEYVEF
ncbi:hypothetical protein GOBAR_DD17141 [Gossypium barbadense]|nr:hypothetical protein GOBAR_DD17141 [Gossypium barbadense]